MTDKEIIIDGEKEKVNILFECNHIKDIEAFDMIKQGIEITPQNAPIGDFKIKIISNVHSPYGFSSICSKSKKSKDWEYMGFGHSGACSVVTALLKELSIKTAECEELKKEIINKNEKIKELRFSVSDLTNRLCSLNAEKSFRIVDLEQTLDKIEKEKIKLEHKLKIAEGALKDIVNIL